MKIIWRIIGALVFGSVFYVGLLFTVFRFALPFLITKVLLWNLIVFNFLGRGAPVGYMPTGEPIYDGATGYGGFSVESILTGFIIYPILVFLILTTVSKIRSNSIEKI